VKEWAKATFTKERMAEVALCVATVSLIGVVAVSLHNSTISLSCLIGSEGSAESSDSKVTIYLVDT